jgi:hypothetical protein
MAAGPAAATADYASVSNSDLQGQRRLTAIAPGGGRLYPPGFGIGRRRLSGSAERMSKMSENPYEMLLREFQEAHARYAGPESFCLHALTDKESLEFSAEVASFALGSHVPGAAPPGGDIQPCYVGCVCRSYRRRPQSYIIMAPRRASRALPPGEEGDEPSEAFKRLAARAGTYLPAIVRDAIPYAPSEPVSSWLAFMYWSNPPTKRRLLPFGRKSWDRRTVWFNPFLDAAEAIVRGKLLKPWSGPLESLQRMPLWDMRPLERGSWGNITGYFDERPGGGVLDMGRWSRLPGCRDDRPVHRPAAVLLPPLWLDGGVRSCYRPRPEDLVLVQHRFPDVSDAAAPPWQLIRTSLLEAGRTVDDIARLDAPKLVELLGSAADSKARATKDKKEPLWTQHRLDEAIRQYRSGRASQYAKFVHDVEAGDKGAIQAARKVFGCRVISDALGCSTAHVNHSGVWQAIAADLKLRRQDSVPRATPIGLDPAMDRAANDKHREMCQATEPAESAQEAELQQLIAEQKQDEKSVKIPKKP